VSPPKEATSVNRLMQAQILEILERGVQLMFVLSEGGHARDFFNVLMGGKIAELESTGRFHHVTLERCDHTMTLLANQHDLIRAVRTWIDRPWVQAGLADLTPVVSTNSPDSQRY
jgi:hypothetical protein